MKDQSVDGSSLAELLAAIREARFSRGMNCPRCDSNRIQRWGQFSGRKRFRCKGCGRTFSDLTGTPAAYIKKLCLWEQYGLRLAASDSVRSSARQLRISPATAFRWRHRLLGPLHSSKPERLGAWIEIDTLRFAYSEKGRRRLGRPARQRGAAQGEALFEPVVVVAACDRGGHAIVWNSGRLFSGVLLRSMLDGNVDECPTICAASGSFSPASAFAVHHRGTFHDTRRRGIRSGAVELLVHTRTARAFCRRLKSWIARFRGVATRYLRNYLMWHLVLDRLHRQSLPAVVLRWPLASKGPQ